jgi:hypothetical protein
LIPFISHFTTTQDIVVKHKPRVYVVSCKRVGRYLEEDLGGYNKGDFISICTNDIDKVTCEECKTSWEYIEACIERDTK